MPGAAETESEEIRPSDYRLMKLAEHHVAQLESFLEKIATDTYPEVPSSLHDEITETMLARVAQTCPMTPGARVLDVGCGQGVALKRFAARGFDATGITLNPIDVAECRKQGFNVLEMDQSFLDFPDASFDMIWCRHCLEHSIYPYFTLSQFNRVLKPGGCLYVEVPAPDTACLHQTNGNHYSVLGKSMLGSLILRSGFDVLDIMDVNFNVPAGPDTYWAYVGKKK
jgi:SAM-dependent methyltransferase